MEKREEQILQGIAASPGIAIGPAFVLGGDVVHIYPRELAEEEVAAEVERFKTALEQARQELGRLREEVARDLGEESARVFEVHQMMLEDHTVIEETIRRITAERKNADLAFYEVMRGVQSSLSAGSDEYLGARAADVRDVKRRVIRHIQGQRHDHLAPLVEPAVIVASDLSPSDTVSLDRSKVLGFATDLGGRTSHAAILARSLELPSVVGLRRVSAVVHTGDMVILDGLRGTLIVNPGPQTVEQYRRRQEEFTLLQKRLELLRELPARTLDGKDIELSANIEFPEEIDSVVAHGAQGVGLFRTEYLYLSGSGLPTEEEQYKAYRMVVEGVAPHPVIIRTFDLGGDKVPQEEGPPEANPFLGRRAIRICLEYHELFKTQLRAILRASAHGEARLLLPMISSLEELLQAKQIIAEAKKELDERGQDYNRDIELGIMIEVPSAAVTADLLAAEVDFLSIGTNDLIQYALAVDRGNQRVAHLFDAYHPAVLRLIKQVVEAGHHRGIWVGMCGEMASDPLATMLLVGLDLDELSVSPVDLPRVKEIVRAIHYEDARAVAEAALRMRSAAEIRAYLAKMLRERLPDLMEGA
ncbi:MAG: phosphoenolpyruvate--protein phosphotransferase [candidate division KSB1 bacterium]|nr:phosphoenolpyruvate--protein phosphotransferase [candidate division KSB1 bacterium]MDZ7385399.1 phosphoenolpyruvate--protein phosphotransferase [candidate division KSB1 bacterium]MDZ7391931.1 phosphoenolpyruvate--protein phosphotransferase [candidate division KSB1 bacterium]